MSKFFRSFGYAWSGIVTFCKTERNFRVQLLAAVAIIIAGLFFRISSAEWVMLLLCCGLVLSLEMINSTIEKLSDILQPSIHPQIRLVKDIAAGAVLLSAFVSLIVALIIFLPKLNL